MIGVVVDYDLVVIPVPVPCVAEIERSNAEVEAVKPKAVGTASANAPDVAASEAAGEASMFEGAVEVVASVIPPGVVSNPLAVVVNVRGFGVAGLITIGGSWRGFLVWGGFLAGRSSLLRSSSHGAVRRRRTVGRDVSATDGVTAGLMVVVLLRKGGQGKGQRYSESENVGSNLMNTSKDYLIIIIIISIATLAGTHR